MCTDDTPKVSANHAGEPSPSTSAPAGGATPKPGWNRRTFLKAAALGTATAAMLGKGSAGEALAHEDTKSSCTANDIEVLGGQIINEPCTCTPGGTFEAIAKFTVINQNNATRKCITLHLGGGGTLGGKDFLLVTGSDGVSGSSNISGLGTTQTMYAKLGTVSCNFGKECYANSAIAFQTAQNQSDTACSGPLQKYPGGQCRRQEICITGFSAKLECVSGCGPDAVPTNCNVGCGGTLYLRASAVGGTDGSTGTYTFTVTAPNGTTQTLTGSSPQCFAITNPQSGTYTLQAADSNGCFREAQSGNVTVTQIAKPTLSGGNPDCDGNVTYTVTNCDANLTYTFKEVDCSTGALIRTLGSGKGTCSLTATFPQDDADHCVVVTASNGDSACDQTSLPVTKHINAPVKVSLNPFVQTDCSGAGSVTAVATGGTGSYTYIFKVNGQEVQRGSNNTLNLPAQLNGQCRTIVVSAVDSNNCPSSPSAPGADTLGISQCVTTTAC